LAQPYSNHQNSYKESCFVVGQIIIVLLYKNDFWMESVVLVKWFEKFKATAQGTEGVFKAIYR